jgi:hypothetical protein
MHDLATIPIAVGVVDCRVSVCTFLFNRLSPGQDCIITPLLACLRSIITVLAMKRALRKTGQSINCEVLRNDCEL